MLTLFDRDARQNRRAFLRIGGSAALGAGGLTLADLAALRARAEGTPGLLSGKSVIFLFLHGGPSQFETFDPKMDAPEGIRSATGEVATRIPGVTFGRSFPRLAALADRLTVVRSFVPGDANHDIKPIVGRDTFGANLGSRLLPRRRRQPPRAPACRPTSSSSPAPSTPRRGRARRPSAGSHATGPLSSADAPFDPEPGRRLLGRAAPGHPARPARRPPRPARRARRARASTGSEQGHRGGRPDPRPGLPPAHGRAGRGVRPGREDPRLVARYDTAPLVRPEDISKKWNNYNNYVDNAKSLGKLLLLARRLCERGCGFVTVTTNFVWDMHADVNNATMDEGMRYMGPPLDHALSAFLEDLDARGLHDKILLVACGEMGRTPRINDKGGRDHWGNLGPLLLAGGGLTMGQVIGHSNRDGSAPQSEPVTARHLIATILHTLFDVGQLRLVPDLPREFAQTMASWDPIPGLTT